MSFYDALLGFDFERPYSLSAAEKRTRVLPLLLELGDIHASRCREYQSIIRSLSFSGSPSCIEDIPFIPVRLFKHMDLLSVPRESVFKTLTSSGTSGSVPSRVFLDRENAAIQSKVLGSTVTSFLGNHRLPMLVVDAEDVLKNRASFSARGAGVVGFSLYGRGMRYALDSSMVLKLDEVRAFALKHGDEGVFLFGFTFVVWKHLYRQLRDAGEHLDFGERSILIHGGGWKKLVDESVSPAEFKARLAETAGIRRVHSYYGMVEQTGSIFMECERGRLHASDFCDVVVRDPISFKPCEIGQEGVVQVISLLPLSYPGHSLLTEDLGTLLGEDNCPCGRLGRYFSVSGRMKASEIRGCSDVRQL